MAKAKTSSKLKFLEEETAKAHFTDSELEQANINHLTKENTILKHSYDEVCIKLAATERELEELKLKQVFIEDIKSKYKEVKAQVKILSKVLTKLITRHEDNRSW